ncbi:T9SS type A sorting domain-containing protein [Prevotella hominis]|uniref:T9SS type A sorting domain-containing protein n=1 Tax=Segatella hominis TaxID=2518605 RepID=UPI001F2C8700|nr:T9SS type A sorting domain-containing protein [Segatella hominis]MCF2591656.1 T9SS type A sorting domain-containing protein [Segatella hominis]
MAIFLLFGAVKGTKAQESNGSAFDGLENLVGISESDIKNGEHGKFPTDDKSQIFFLYNVKTDLLLNVGGYWGTHVSLQEYGMPLWVYKDTDGWIHFQQDIDKQSASSGEGCSLEYFYDAKNTGNAAVNNGVFVDRDIYKSSKDKTVIQRGWTIESIGDDKNTFRIYTYRRNEDGYSNDKTYEKYYLSAAASQGDVDKNCGAFTTDDKDYSKDGSQWRIFSYQQLYELQEKSLALKSSLDLSFKLECPGFNRDNGALAKWNTDVYKKGATRSFRFGLEKRYKTDPSDGLDDYKGSVASDNSYTFNGIKYTSMNDYQTHLGKYYCADIKNTRGAVYQVVHVEYGGSYVIECKAYSNTNKAKLFAVLLKDPKEGTTNYKEIVDGSFRETVVMQTANMSQTEQTNLHISEQNMDYAGKEFYGSHKYFNSVLVQVPEGGGNICFGVRVGSVAENENVAKDGEWTVFDDFRLLYAGSNTSRDLILDEDKDNLNYLLDCTETYDDVVLHLNKKSFNKNINKWNTIVLPVDLKKDQFTQAFGANARLAVLTKLTRNQIQFETVEIAKKGNNEVVLDAYVPYIIYPTKDLANERTPAYTAILHKTGAGTEGGEHKVTIAENHIDIPNVSLKRNDQNKNDLFGLIKETWSLDLNHVKVADKPGDSEIVTDGTLAAYGTFARTYGRIMENDEQTTFTVDKSNPIISGRDDLKGCYFFHEGKMVYAGDKVRGLRGFSVWFKPSGTATSKFILDGIDYTTDVERIMATEDSSIDSKFAKLGVFNLNGQLVRSGSTDVSGLPSGIYIVNGKKVFVK